jgi:hypothetical protein
VAAARRGQVELPAAGADREGVLVVAQDDHQRPCVDECATALGDELEHPVEIRLAADRPRDRRRRLESRDRALERIAPLLHAAIQARVLDRDGGPLGEHHDGVLVHLGERLAAVLLGEVEVAPRLAPDHDRHAQERAHGRVSGRGTRTSAGRRSPTRGAAAAGRR